MIQLGHTREGLLQTITVQAEQSKIPQQIQALL